MIGEEQSPQIIPETGYDPILSPGSNDDDVLLKLKLFTLDIFDEEQTDHDFIGAMRREFPMPAAYLYGKRSKDKLAVDIITQEEGYISCTGATVLSWYWLQSRYPDISTVVLTHRLSRFTHAFTLGIEHPTDRNLERFIAQMDEQIQLYKNSQPMDQSLGIHLFDLTENGGFGMPVRSELPHVGILSSCPIDVSIATSDNDWRLFTTIEEYVRYVRNDSALRIREKQV